MQLLMIWKAAEPVMCRLPFLRSDHHDMGSWLLNLLTASAAARCRVADTLPKHWGGRGPAAIPEQLSAKANSAAVLLDTLQHAGVLDQLPPVALR
jgi:hypothetical protein